MRKAPNMWLQWLQRLPLGMSVIARIFYPWVWPVTGAFSTDFMLPHERYMSPSASRNPHSGGWCNRILGASLRVTDNCRKDDFVYTV